MTIDEFNELVGKNIIILYHFQDEIQEWNMKDFEFDENGNARHKFMPIIMKAFIHNAICVKDTSYYYNKALDDFISKAAEERDEIYNWDEDDYENGMRAGYQYSIDIAEQLRNSRDIAEQLKKSLMIEVRKGVEYDD